MAKDANGKWIGYGVGDSGPDVALINLFLYNKYQWAKDMGVKPGDVFTSITALAVAELYARTGITPVLDAKGQPVATLKLRTRLGSYPPPPPPRHALLTFSGTWAAPGTGYCSWVAQRCGQAVEEVPVISPWSFGPIGGDPHAPSYKESVEIGVEWAVQWLLAHPTRTFMLGGYSQGGEAASRVYMETLPGGRLAHLRGNYVGGFTFGNPCRQKGHTYVGGKDPGGQGIATVRLSNMGNEWLDCARPGDLYTTCPDDASGVIETDVYAIATDIQISNFMGFVSSFVQGALKVVNDIGGIGGILGSLGGGLFPDLLIGLLAGISGKPTTSKNLSAAIKAAITGLKFIAASPPTAAHITYEFPIPDQPQWSYIDLAVQHVNDWASRTPVRL